MSDARLTGLPPVTGDCWLQVIWRRRLEQTGLIPDIGNWRSETVSSGKVFDLKNGEGSLSDFLIRGGPVGGSSRMISELK